MSTNNSSVQDSVSAQQLAEEQHLFLHYESHGAAGPGTGPNHELPAHLLPGHVTPEPPDHPDHGSTNGNSKDAKRNGHGKNNFVKRSEGGPKERVSEAFNKNCQFLYHFRKNRTFKLFLKRKTFIFQG